MRELLLVDVPRVEVGPASPGVARSFPRGLLRLTTFPLEEMTSDELRLEGRYWRARADDTEDSGGFPWAELERVNRELIRRAHLPVPLPLAGRTEYFRCPPRLPRGGTSS